MDQAEKVITPTAASAVGGAIIGSHRAFGIGLLPGAGLGAALGLGAVLLKRGDEINLPQGTNVEMVLEAPFSLDQAQMAANARYVRPSQAVNDYAAGLLTSMSRETQEDVSARHSEQSTHSRFLFPIELNQQILGASLRIKARSRRPPLSLKDRSLFVPQGNHGIHLRSPVRGDVTCQQGNNSDDSHYRGKSHNVSGFNAKQQAAEGCGKLRRNQMTGPIPPPLRFP